MRCCARKSKALLKTLTYREREIIRLRYGLGDGYTYTLEEVGRIFKVTRERVRQIEAKAVRKLQHPVRSQQLEGFLERVAGLTRAVKPPVTRSAAFFISRQPPFIQPRSNGIRDESGHRNAAHAAPHPHPTDRPECAAAARSQPHPCPPEQRPAHARTSLTPSASNSRRPEWPPTPSKVNSATAKRRSEKLQTQLNMANNNREYQLLKEQIAATEMANSVTADEILEGTRTDRRVRRQDRRGRSRGGQGPGRARQGRKAVCRGRAVDPRRRRATRSRTESRPKPFCPATSSPSTIAPSTPATETPWRRSRANTATAATRRCR